MVGWLDYVLVPALAVFLAITVYALIRRRRGNRAVGDPEESRRTHA
ncbi:MAG: mercury resistance system transport protein MerF [Candidatus Rokubacteria bacterium]|nr:mercury resistance system transport protein MerF [Candidatus Rokubacteria bacterium]